MAKRLLMGNEAFAHAALEAGVNVVAGYPGTPSSEVIETVARLRNSGKAEGVYVEWSTNEKAALEVAAAAAMSGARAMFTCKQVGLNVASDALMSLNYVGVRGGLVILVADDPGPISSQTEQDTRRFASFAKVPVLDPATPEQGFLMIKEAFELSERYRTPVIVRPTTRIDHASTFFEVEPRTVARSIPQGGFRRDPNEWVIFPKRSYRAHAEIIQRLNSIAYDFTYDANLNRFNNGFDKMVGMPSRPLPDLSTELGGNASRPDDMYDDDFAGERPKLGIVCGGVSRQYALEAISIIEREAEAAGVMVPSYRLLQIGTPYPFPRRIASRFLKDLSDVLVLEELDHVIEDELLKVSGVSFLSPNIHGKLTKEANERGENSTEDAAYRISAFFDKYARPDVQLAQSYGLQNVPLQQLVERVLGPKALLAYNGELPSRPPVLCAGCPHRGSFYAMKRAIKKLKIPREDAIFCGDIGCCTLGNAMPLDACDTCLCMGAGITMAQGFAATNPEKKNIAFIGDSTFFASGMTGIANAVYNNHDITICVLDNATTAMTGSQPHPGTGVTLMGEHNKPIDIPGVLRALGVDSIYEVDPLDKTASEEACINALSEAAPTAIIFKSPCIWLQPFDAPAKVHVNACTGCKKCITEIGCPAIGFDPNAKGAKSGDRGQAIIDESQCNGCGLCLQVCPFKAIEILTPEEKALFESASRATSGKGKAPGSISFGDASSESSDAADGGSARAVQASVGIDVEEPYQRTHLGSDETDLEENFEPLEDVADAMLELEETFEMDAGSLMLDVDLGEGDVSKPDPDDLPEGAVRVGSGIAHPKAAKRAREDEDGRSSKAANASDATKTTNASNASDLESEEAIRQRSLRQRRSANRIPDEPTEVSRVKVEELGDNYDGLVGNLAGAIDSDTLEEYSAAAAAYGAAKSKVIRADRAKVSREAIGADANAEDGEQPKRYYMKNTSYRRRAFRNAAGARSSVLENASSNMLGNPTDDALSNAAIEDALSIDERRSRSAQVAVDPEREAELVKQEEEALDVFDALNSSVYIEVGDEEEPSQQPVPQRSPHRGAIEMDDEPKRVPDNSAMSTETKEEDHAAVQAAARAAAKEAAHAAAQEAVRAVELQRAQAEQSRHPNRSTESRDDDKPAVRRSRWGGRG